MRAISTALSTAWEGFEWTRFVRFCEVVATIIATTGAVLVVSFLAVSTGLT